MPLPRPPQLKMFSDLDFVVVALGDRAWHIGHFCKGNPLLLSKDEVAGRGPPAQLSRVHAASMVIVDVMRRRGRGPGPRAQARAEAEAEAEVARLAEEAAAEQRAEQAADQRPKNVVLHVSSLPVQQRPPRPDTADSYDDESGELRGEASEVAELAAVAKVEAAAEEAGSKASKPKKGGKGRSVSPRRAQQGGRGAGSGGAVRRAGGRGTKAGGKVAPKMVTAARGPRAAKAAAAAAAAEADGKQSSGKPAPAKRAVRGVSASLTAPTGSRRQRAAGEAKVYQRRIGCLW